MNIIDGIREKCFEKATKTVMSISYDNGDYREITYRDMLEQINTNVDSLRMIGLSEGDRIVIVAENSPEWVMCFLAICDAKCTAVLIDPSLTAAEILELINFSEPMAVLMSPKVKEKLNRTVSNEFPVLNLLDNMTAFQGELGVTSPGASVLADTDTSVAVIIYSSGTTRRAAGVMHTHEAMLGTTDAAIAFNSLNDRDKMLVVLPLYHIYGMVTCLIGPLALGASLHFIESVTSAGVVRAFTEFKPTIFSCVPRVFDAFKDQIQKKMDAKGGAASFLIKRLIPLCYTARKTLGINLGRRIFKSVHEGFGDEVRIFCAAGTPLDPETAYFYYALGFNLLLNYGLTETNVPIIANSFSNYTIHSCGKCYDHVSMKIANPDESGTGEILIKTPFMMKGYFKDAEATNDSFDKDGWFKTGDLAAMDQKGNVSVTGRMKDNIVLSTGKKISPERLEDNYAGVAGVKELVICGIPAGTFDEIHAFVVIDKTAGVDGSSIEREIFSREATLSQHMRITAVHFMEELPYTSLQKPKRYLLKKNYLNQTATAKSHVKVPLAEVSIDLEAELFRIICEMKKREMTITHHMRLNGDLMLDSLDAMDLDVRLEERTGKSIYGFLERDMTVGELLGVLNRIDSQEQGASSLDISKYPYQKGVIDRLAFSAAKYMAKAVYNFEVKGLDNLPADGGFILCPNHETYFDSFLVLMNLPKNYYDKICCMAKQEIAMGKSPLNGIIMRAGGIIPVDRSGNAVPAMRACLERLKESRVVLIHPEGTRSVTGSMGVFKAGASKLSLDSNKPIVPVRIKGAYHIYPVGQRLPKLFNFKSFQRYKLEISFGAPIEPVGVDPLSLTALLRDKILEL